MRETIAKRLLASKQSVPHYQLAATVNVEKTLEMRKRVNERLAAEKIDVKVSSHILKSYNQGKYMLVLIYKFIIVKYKIIGRPNSFLS